MHDRFFAEISAFELAAYAAFVHDEHAVRHAEHFFHFAGGGEDRHAIGREFLHQAIDLFFGADIDAARRFVEQQDAWS